MLINNIRYLLFTVFICIILLCVNNASTTSETCIQYSAKDTDEYWDAVGKCPSCTSITGCGFCMSSLQCLEGNDKGPTNGLPCSSCSFSNVTCPGL